MGAEKRVGYVGREELGLVKNIFIINKQGCKGGWRDSGDFDGQEDSGILAPSLCSDSFNL